MLLAIWYGLMGKADRRARTMVEQNLIHNVVLVLYLCVIFGIDKAHQIVCGGEILVSFLPSVFDRLQYAKLEGEGPGERVKCMMSGRHEGRCEGGGA